MMNNKKMPGLDAAVIQRFATLPSANVADAMERLGVVDPHVRAIWPGARVVGPAFTVLTRGGDNLFLHKALDAVQPGEVIVVNGQGDESRALLGELMAARAKMRGVAGFVIDGAVRDAASLAASGMPVFARAVSPAGPYKHGPGALGKAIAVGGVVVAPGDIVLGDADGVVVVPQAEALAVLAEAEAINVRERARLSAIMSDDTHEAQPDESSRFGTQGQASGADSSA